MLHVLQASGDDLRFPFALLQEYWVPGIGFRKGILQLWLWRWLGLRLGRLLLLAKGGAGCTRFVYAAETNNGHSLPGPRETHGFWTELGTLRSSLLALVVWSMGISDCPLSTGQLSHRLQAGLWRESAPRAQLAVLDRKLLSSSGHIDASLGQIGLKSTQVKDSPFHDWMGPSSYERPPLAGAVARHVTLGTPQMRRINTQGRIDEGSPETPRSYWYTSTAVYLSTQVTGRPAHEHHTQCFFSFPSTPDFQAWSLHQAVYAFFLAAALALAAFFWLLRIMTMPRNEPTTAEAKRIRMTGMRIAQTRGGNKFCRGWSESTKGCRGRVG